MAKRAREVSDHEEDSTSDSAFKRIKHVPLPDTVKALPNVMNLIATLSMTPEEALKEALATHELDWMKQIISNFDCDLTETVVQAAVTNQQDVVKLVLFGFLTHADTVRGKFPDCTKVLVEKAIVAAAKNGHLDIVKSLLRTIVDFWKYPFSPIRDVMDAAAVNGQLNVVEFMAQHAVALRYDTQYSSCSSVDTLSKAILGGHTNVAEFLLNQTRILWNLKCAYPAAVDLGQAALAGRIYELYPQQTRGQNLFLDLASSGHLEAVTYLYNNGCDDSGLVAKAFTSAAYYSKYDVVKFLADTGQVNSETFDKAFKTACSGYQFFDTAMFLYNLKRVSSQGINHGFESSNVAIMKFLCEKETISDNAISNAFATALSLDHRPHSEVILFLYKKPCISSALIDTAFVNAVLSVTTEIVNSLKDDERLSSNAMGKAFVGAVKNQNVDMMKLVYDERRTPGEALVRALMESAHRKRIDLVKNIVKLLAAKPRKFMHEAFVVAARHGQMSILEIVYQSQPADLPLKVLGAALDVAGGNGKMENFIRKLVCDQVFREKLPAA